MPKVAIFIPNDRLGGAEQYLKMIALYYVNKGFYIKVFFLSARTGKGWDEFKEVKNIDLIFSNSRNEFSGIIKIIKYFLSNRNKIKFDYIYTSHVKINALTGILLKLNLFEKKYFFARESTSVFKRYKGFKLITYRFLYNIGYSKIDVLICQTDYMKKQLIEELPWLVDKTAVIHNPIDITSIGKKSKENLPLEEEEELGDYIVSAGRLIHEKGFDILIESFYKIHTKHNKHIKLLILGEGKKRSDLELMIANYNLSNNVILKGFVDNVFPYFKNAKLCVVSSRIEGFPNVLLQMMSQNGQIISTNCAGGIKNIPQINVCEVDSVEGLYRELLNVLTKKPDNSRRCFNDYLEAISINSFIKELENIKTI